MYMDRHLFTPQVYAKHSIYIRKSNSLSFHEYRLRLKHYYTSRHGSVIACFIINVHGYTVFKNIVNGMKQLLVFTIIIIFIFSHQPPTQNYVRINLERF